MAVITWPWCGLLQEVGVGQYSVSPGKPVVLALKYAIANDARWAGQTGELAPDRFNPDRWVMVPSSCCSTL